MISLLHEVINFFRKISKPLSPPSDFTHTSAFTLEWISAAGNDRNISYAVVIKTEKERKTIFDEVVFSSILNASLFKKKIILRPDISIKYSFFLFPNPPWQSPSYCL